MSLEGAEVALTDDGEGILLLEEDESPFPEVLPTIGMLVAVCLPLLGAVTGLVGFLDGSLGVVLEGTGTLLDNRPALLLICRVLDGEGLVGMVLERGDTLGGARTDFGFTGRRPLVDLLK